MMLPDNEQKWRCRGKQRRQDDRITNAVSVTHGI